ncbi:unnamed protein product [Pleuronectes platessa]|uniref:Uncharacterized protein n=1 Tax=Pleuronectes platessa TaxID=8262 RepID=A0A9N7UDL9_PLEPL|nr:unnamed protein product [Pleuronectes platessa]
MVSNPESPQSVHVKRESSKHSETRRSSIKISNATTLQKTGEYITKMQQERTQLQEQAQKLREEVQLLNSDINACQMQLPATGVPITRQRFDHMRQKFREYVRMQTLQNWKFWIFGFIIEPLFESYNSNGVHCQRGGPL